MVMKMMMAKQGGLMATFDTIIMNPPYNGNKLKSIVNGKIWHKFVEKSLKLVKDNGYVCSINPSPWRKPKSKLFNEFKNRQLKYLEIHNIQDGKTTFNCSTRYDWYILKNSKSDNKYTMIKDELGVICKVNMNELDFLPNCEYDLIKEITNKEDKFNILSSSRSYDTRKPWISKSKILYSRCSYGCDKPHVNQTPTQEFKYPCVFSMTKSNPLTLSWSSTKDKGHFGIPKVIINLPGATLCCLVDDKGEYGMSQWIFGIEINSKEEGELIKRALMSDKFNRIWMATKWMAMTREWRFFEYLRKDFYKDFI